MKLIATGLTGTIGRKFDEEVESAKVTLGKDNLIKYFDPKEGPITLIHLGGVVGESNVSSDLTFSHSINVTETLNLAREVIEIFNGRFIYISTSHVYGPRTDLLTESSPIEPKSNYADQKAKAETELLKHFGPEHPQLMILRVFSVLGWDVADFTLGGAVKRVIAGSDETISNTDDVRDFMTPTSIAAAIKKIANTSQAFGVYNLCTGSGLSVGDAVLDMLRIKRVDVKPGQLKRGYSINPHIVGSNIKIKCLGIPLDLNWDPFGEIKKNLDESDA